MKPWNDLESPLKSLKSQSDANNSKVNAEIKKSEYFRLFDRDLFINENSISVIQIPPDTKTKYSCNIFLILLDKLLYRSFCFYLSA